MEGHSTNAALTEEELRNAGASDAYISYYLTARAMGKRTNSTNHAEAVVREGRSFSGGSFHEALWNAEPRFENSDNPYGADSQNKKILQVAGVYPSDEKDALIA